MNSIKFIFKLAAIMLTFVPLGFSEDWPMWRYDANRSAASPLELPEQLHLQWVREYPPLEPTWENPLNQDLMQFDKVYEPVVMGNTLFIGSNAYDRMVALDTKTGQEKWSFYTDGPVRFPAVAAKGKVYFVSDDGYLYCVDAKQGKLIWKYRGIPKDRKILGNERLISTWPARGGPVIKDGIVYFANGIWPFMGVFIYALDAETGEEIWCNDSSSAIYMKQPHNSPSFASIAPQGILVISGDKLLVPGGRSVPACFDLTTGELLYYQLSEHNKTGGAFVCATDNHFINYHRDKVTSLYDLANGDVLIRRFGTIPVLTNQAFYCLGKNITALDYDEMKEVGTEKEKKWVINKLWDYPIDSSGDLIKAGNRLYAGGKNKIIAIDIPSAGEQPDVSWETKIEGQVSRIIAAENKLFVVTLEGHIYAFGDEANTVRKHPLVVESKKLDKTIVDRAKNILDTTKVKEGYCLAYGLTDGDLIEALVRNSNLRIMAVDSDKQTVNRLRQRFVKAGLYGKRLSILRGDPLTFEAPPYLASLIVFEDLDSLKIEKNERFFKIIYRSVRPYGGTLCLPINGKDEKISTIKTIQQSRLSKAKIYELGGNLWVKREGSLPGSSDWTHQYGDIQNTVKSDDKRVTLPLGILWFGGSSNTDVLPRHGHGPPEQIMNGRLFIEGIDSLSARDVYTGRVLWKRIIPGLDNYNVYYDKTYKNTPLDPSYNQIHIPGANARGTNYVVTKDKIYIVQNKDCLVLDPATGETLDQFQLPSLPCQETPPDWGYIGVYKDYLIASADFVDYNHFLQSRSEMPYKRKVFLDFDISSSKRLVVLNRHSGEVIWTFNSELGLRHNTIVAGNGKIFCIDKMPDTVADALKRRGKDYIGTPRLLSFDIQNGDIIWSKTENIFGTWLGYSEEHDVLLESGRKSRDMLYGEPEEGMAGHRGANGDLLWRHDHAYNGPCIIHNETIITDPHAFNLLTGKHEMRENPLTGEKNLWAYDRNYGCNYTIASENLLTFRSAAAGFFDLNRDSGTGNFGGFKSGCTSNLIAANGVLNAPDYTRTCSCSYQNQTSLALIHDPDVDMWTFNSLNISRKSINQIGINLGAPGDRESDNGTLWLEYPFVGGPSPNITIKKEPEQVTYFRHHSSRLRGSQLKWIAASGAEGLQKITVKLAAEQRNTRMYTVRLVFSEPKNIKPSERIFDVCIQDKKVLEQFDILKQAGSANKSLIKEFNDIPINQDLVIELKSQNQDTNHQPVLCGIEVIRNQYLSLN